jgi:hypothetical protein
MVAMSHILKSGLNLMMNVQYGTVLVDVEDD